MSDIHAVSNTIAELIPQTRAFLNNILIFDVELLFDPQKGHKAVLIKYVNDLPKTDDFISDLVSSIIRYVYSKSKQKEILHDLITQRDESDAWMKLRHFAKSKFREHNAKGQFSELLLYNILCSQFDAIPVVRKMKITTNPKNERNGADAIHLGIKNNQYIFYIGESKTYTSGLKSAFTEAVSSILMSFHDHKKELNLYKYEDFIEPECLEVTKDYLNGSLPNAQSILVSLITYELTSKPSLGISDDDTIKEILDKVKSNIEQLDEGLLKAVDDKIKLKMIFYFVPIHQLENLLLVFERDLGI